MREFKGRGFVFQGYLFLEKLREGDDLLWKYDLANYFLIALVTTWSRL